MDQTNGQYCFGNFDPTSESERLIKDQKLLNRDLSSKNAHVLHADPQKRIQAFRHQPGQLTSIQNYNLDELELLRKENQKRCEQLKEMYEQGCEQF